MQPPDEKDISIFWSLDVIAREQVEIAVTLPTFRRPEHVVETLQSILEQTTKRAFATIVMENETEDRAGAEAASTFMAAEKMHGAVVLAHRRGNCSAYNAGWWTALDLYPDLKWVLVIDDDELAVPDWLERMAALGENLNPDFIGAPQVPVFEKGSDLKQSSHSVFRQPYDKTGMVPILYSSGNVLISVSRLRSAGHPWLDEKFNFLGGGDSDFYARQKADGATFAWEKDAIVHETIPARRTELSWLNSRALRNGSISALIQKRATRSPADHARRWFKTLALVAASPYRSLILFVKTGSLTMGLTHMNVALGRLLMEFGFANEQYRAADKN